jgi:hypothetical protein
MENRIVLVLVTTTSLVALALGLRARGLSARGLRDALLFTAEAFGLGFAFLAANVGLGAFMALAGRAVGAPFVSMYASTDSTLLSLSFLQGLVVRLWADSEPRVPRQQRPRDPGSS